MDARQSKQNITMPKAVEAEYNNADSSLEYSKSNIQDSVLSYRKSNLSAEKDKPLEIVGGG